MNWLDALGSTVDIYCERTSAAFWSEPINALSNLAFVIAAVAVWRDLRGTKPQPLSIGFMAPLMILIGIGSFAFHTIATRWSQVLDITPITLFVLWYFGSFLIWFYQLNSKRAFAGVAALAAGIAVFIVLFDRFIPNHSGMYVPVLLLLVGLTLALRGSDDAGRAQYWPALAAAALVFAVALAARTVDQNVCGAFSPGTHFLWHTLDGLLLYLVSRPLVHRWSACRPDSTAPRESVALG